MKMACCQWCGESEDLNSNHTAWSWQFLTVTESALSHSYFPLLFHFIYLLYLFIYFLCNFSLQYLYCKVDWRWIFCTFLSLFFSSFFQVICLHDAQSIYAVPLMLEEQQISHMLSDRLNLSLDSCRPRKFLKKWCDLSTKWVKKAA